MTTGDLKSFWKRFELDTEFDPAGFQNLLNDTNEDTVLRILAAFRVTLVQSIDRLGSGLAANDADSLLRSCHKLSGSSQLLGFKALGELSSGLNSQLKASSDLEPLKKDITELKMLSGRVAQAIDTTCPNLNDYL